MALRIVLGIVGLFFVVQAGQWIVAPAAAAEGLGMPLLDGVGRSTQIGDIGAFFLSLGILTLLGAYRSSPHWLRAAALLIGAVAVLRTLAWLLHGAPFTAVFIAVEVVVAGLLLFAAHRFETAAST
jgi:hypothetical protein